MFLKKLAVNMAFFISNLYRFVSFRREKQIAGLLIKNALKISSAESCTGGLLSSRLTDISGSSAYIFQNFVTYANSAKVKILGVNPSIIEKNGAVSRKTALEMVKGLLYEYDCTVAISTTGIAGPLGATNTKPIGLIYIGIGNEKCQKVYRYEADKLLFRPIMKFAFTFKALDLLYEFLKENY